MIANRSLFSQTIKLLDEMTNAGLPCKADPLDNRMDILGIAFSLNEPDDQCVAIFVENNENATIMIHSMLKRIPAQKLSRIMDAAHEIQKEYPFMLFETEMSDAGMVLHENIPVGPLAELDISGIELYNLVVNVTRCAYKYLDMALHTDAELKDFFINGV